MSRNMYRGREKKVQKMERDGLVEQNRVTGEEQRISQRLADVSFDHERTANQAAGHRAAQRIEDGAKDRKRHKQRAIIYQTAAEAAKAAPAEPSEDSRTPEPPAPSMRMAVDAPLIVSPAAGNEPPPAPTQARSRRRRRKARKKAKKQRKITQFTPDAARADGEKPAPEPEDPLLHTANDVPIRPPDTREDDEPDAKRRDRLIEDGGRLRFDRDMDAGVDEESGKKAAQRRQMRRFAQDAAVDTPAGAAPRPPTRLHDDGGGRLHFEDARDAAVAAAPAAGQISDPRKAVKRRQIMELSPDAAKPERFQGADRSTQPPARDGAAVPADQLYTRQRDEKSAEPASQPGRSRLRFEDAPPAAEPSSGGQNKDTGPATTESAPSRGYQRAARKVARAEEQVEQAREKLPAKHRLTMEREVDGSTGRPRHRLHFETEVQPEYVKPSLPSQAGQAVRTAAVMKLHSKVHESERDNVAVEAAHRSELMAEQGAGRALRWNRQRRRSSPYRALRQAERQAARERVEFAWQTALRDNPELRKSNALMKWVQKQKLKRKYAQAAHEAKQTAQFTQNVLTATGKIARIAAQYAAAHKSLLAIVALLAMVVVFFSAGMTSCTAMLSGFQSSYISASYMADEQEICDSDLYYTEMETDLQIDINNTEINYPGYDEYRYNIGEIGHDPYKLLGYLSTMFNAFTFDEMKGEIERLFHEQYTLTRETIIETRYDSEGNPYDWYVLQTTLTVRPLSDIISGSLTAGEQTDRYSVYLETRGNRQAFGNPFDFPWLGHVTSDYGYRVHPITGQKDLHRGVDIAAAQGTPIRAVHDGRVVSAGDAGSYGLCVVIEDEKGYQSRYAHCSSIGVSVGQEVKRGDVIAAVGSTGQSTGPHLHLEIKLDGEYLNPYFFVDAGDDGRTNALPGTPGGPVIPEYAGAPVTDERFGAMLAEAQKYLGYPYVWGGANPTTSFDCSGYVSWVINHSGWDFGRLGVLGLESVCTLVSGENVQPGDLVFFIGTYDAPLPGPTHVGIYLGNGQFIHCGSSGVTYGNLSSNYWTEHFYGFGRLP